MRYVPEGKEGGSSQYNPTLEIVTQVLLLRPRCIGPGRAQT